MTICETVEALNNLEVSALCCEACWHEHSCRDKGCAIIRAAGEYLLAYEWWHTLGRGLTPKRCAELAEADKEGRLVVLPCKED